MSELRAGCPNLRHSSLSPSYDVILCNLVNGFQLATLAGPICEEPMLGVGFILEDWTLEQEGDSGWGPLSGQIVSTFKVNQVYIN